MHRHPIEALEPRRVPTHEGEISDSPTSQYHRQKLALGNIIEFGVNEQLNGSGQGGWFLVPRRLFQDFKGLNFAALTILEFFFPTTVEDTIGSWGNVYEFMSALIIR